MKEQKKLLRKQIREEKKHQTTNELMIRSSALLEKIEKHPHFIASRTILCYHSLSDEVQTHAFLEKWHTNKKILLPVVVEDILELRHYTGKDCLKVGAFGIEEPTGRNFTDFDEIELGIIPGMSFDRQGNRLGRGKGYYDKLLPLLHTYNIGICYHFQAREEIPCEPFDQRMDEVWTEEGRWY
ncbi:MAG: 5-formyltetrahydrofolate cyclo-ligase [Bacteroides sp.]|nr:5-formyltetrahydrofolate cyclo-ligase [Bacteroides sp.]